MKIAVKIEPETLFILQRILLLKLKLTPRNRTGKITTSIRQELFEILSRKCVSYTVKPNGKPISTELRYHLASQLLEDVAHILAYDDLNIYERNKLEMFKNQTHQKLL